MGDPKPRIGDATAEARQLLERVARGDREAFHAFYDCYGARVMAVVRRRVAARQLAEELVQDVFVAAWLGAPGYRGEMGDPEPWLLGITRHKLQDHWRRVRGLVAAMGAHADHVRVESRMPDYDLQLAVEEALAALPAAQRRVLDLIYLCHFAPWSTFPRHRHVGLEHNVILAGGYRNGNIRVDAGDWVVGAPGTVELSRADADGCWCLSRIESPGVRFTGWRRWVAPLLAR